MQSVRMLRTGCFFILRIAPAAAGKGTDYDHRKETKVNRQKPENKKDAEKALEGVYAAEYEAEGVLRELDRRRLTAFEHLPFHVYTDEQMAELVESVRQNGVITPVIVRPRSGGDTFEIISGHHRVDACMFADIQTVPCVIREMNDQDAMICMVDSNLHQRGDLKISEKALAYKLKMEAIQQKRANGDPMEHRKTRDLVGMEGCDSGAQVQRYLRLNKLIPEFQKKVDNATMCMRAGVELSYLSPAEQKTLWSAMLKEQVSPSTEQAKRIRKLSGSSDFTIRNLRAVLTGKEIDLESPAKPVAEEPKENSVALLAPNHAVLTSSVERESVEKPMQTAETSTDEASTPITEEPTLEEANEAPIMQERVIRLPWSALVPYFSEEMTDAEVEQAILDLLRQHGERRETAVPRLVALP